MQSANGRKARVGALSDVNGQIHTIGQRQVSFDVEADQRDQSTYPLVLVRFNSVQADSTTALDTRFGMRTRP